MPKLESKNEIKSRYRIKEEPNTLSRIRESTWTNFQSSCFSFSDISPLIQTSPNYPPVHAIFINDLERNDRLQRSNCNSKG